MNELNIHQFMDHHHENLPSGASTIAPPRIIPMSFANERNIIERVSCPPGQVVHHPGLVYAVSRPPIHHDPNAGIPRINHNPPSINLTNGAPNSREGSISSDSAGEGRAASPIVNLKCELCGLSNITSSKALQQVSSNLFVWVELICLKFCFKLTHFVLENLLKPGEQFL